MFNVHRIEKVVGPVFGPDFGPTSDFFGVVPGVFPGGFGIVERYFREVLGVFRAICVRSCAGRSPGIFPALPDGF